MVMHSAQFFRRTKGINAEARLHSRWLMRLFSALAKARSALQSELRARRDAAELASMDDRMLRDIGISRSEIDFLVRRPVPDRRGEHRHNVSKAMATNSKNVHESSIYLPRSWEREIYPVYSR